MKSRREDFYHAFLQRPFETSQQPALLEIRQQRDQGLAHRTCFAYAREPRQRDVPNLNIKPGVRCKNADVGLRCCD